MQKITTPQKAFMQSLFLILVTMLMASVTLAGPKEDTKAAYERKDYKLVVKIVNPLAIEGEVWAQNWLADAYLLGQGVAQDYAEAAKWYRLAAEQGDASAQNSLAFMYDTGKGVKKDYAEAAKWYRLAAQQGNSSAQSNLGAMYANGQGVAQDYVKAHSWYQLSTLNGSTGAVKNRDIVAKQMTPQQIVDAQKLAQDCQARQFKECD
jgi:TPR repeat protein